jgi:hypothetical protein
MRPEWPEDFKKTRFSVRLSGKAFIVAFDICFSPCLFFTSPNLAQESTMKKIFDAAVTGTLAASLALLFSASAMAAAADPAAAPKTAQQSKMVSCNADASGKKGDERKAFMKDCLSAKPVAAASAPPLNSQQNKMKTCNADATGKKGDERKAFMKTCLSAK